MVRQCGVFQNIWYRSTLTLWLVESIQSIHKNMWSIHDNRISASGISSSRGVHSLTSFRAPRQCNVLKLLQTQREMSSFAECFKNVQWNSYGFRFSHDIMDCKTLCLLYMPQSSASADNWDLSIMIISLSISSNI